MSGCDGVADGGNVAVNEICTEEAEQMVAGICSEDSGYKLTVILILTLRLM